MHVKAFLISLAAASIVVLGMFMFPKIVTFTSTPLVFILAALVFIGVPFEPLLPIAIYATWVLVPIAVFCLTYTLCRANNHGKIAAAKRS